jgi:glycosyltransferase involved in cell wall biosynthesis
MMRLFSSFRPVLLLFLDLATPAHQRARRREHADVLIHHLKGVGLRLADLAVPQRRVATAARARAMAALSKGQEKAQGAMSIALGDALPADGNPLVTGLRIAVFIPSFLRGQGGAEKVAGQLANLLADRGAKVDLFCRAPEDPQAPHSLAQAIRICLLDERDDDRIRRYRDEHYDLIVGFGMAHFYRRIPHIAELLRAPFVIQECTNPTSMIALLHRLSDAHSLIEAEWLRQAVLAHAAGARFTTAAYAQTVAEDVRPFTYAFYNAFGTPQGWQYDATRKPSRKLICVGAFKNENKNGMAALRAFCAFTKRHPGWTLVLYGDNNYAAEVARTLAAQPDVSVLDEGAVQDVAAMYADAYALLIPSFEEGLPNVVVEAFSFGVPCIGFSDCVGVRQLICDGETGLLVERSEPHGLEAALQTLADPCAQRRLAHAAREFASEHFDFSHWCRNWLELIHNAANGLNNQRSPQQPAACDLTRDYSSEWSRLLDSYRAIA